MLELQAAPGVNSTGRLLGVLLLESLLPEGWGELEDSTGGPDVPAAHRRAREHQAVAGAAGGAGGCAGCTRTATATTRMINSGFRRRRHFRSHRGSASWGRTIVRIADQGSGRGRRGIRRRADSSPGAVCRRPRTRRQCPGRRGPWRSHQSRRDRWCVRRRLGCTRTLRGSNSCRSRARGSPEPADHNLVDRGRRWDPRGCRCRSGFVGITVRAEFRCTGA